MFVQATISCKCGCIFESEFQKSSVENPPKCPQCGQAMNDTSWKSLRDTMAQFGDLNQHIVKWHLEREEPLMQVPAITVRTLRD
jgi:hypothetical protein